MAIRKFQRGSSTYTCRTCGKNTRDTEGEASCRLCKDCFNLSSIENSLFDGELDESWLSEASRILERRPELKDKFEDLAVAAGMMPLTHVVYNCKPEILQKIDLNDFTAEMEKQFRLSPKWHDVEITGFEHDDKRTGITQLTWKGKKGPGKRRCNITAYDHEFAEILQKAIDECLAKSRA